MKAYVCLAVASAMLVAGCAAKPEVVSTGGTGSLPPVPSLEASYVRNPPSDAGVPLSAGVTRFAGKSLVFFRQGYLDNAKDETTEVVALAHLFGNEPNTAEVFPPSRGAIPTEVADPVAGAVHVETSPDGEYVLEYTTGAAPLVVRRADDGSVVYRSNQSAFAASWVSPRLLLHGGSSRDDAAAALEVVDLGTMPVKSRSIDISSSPDGSAVDRVVACPSVGGALFSVDDGSGEGSALWWLDPVALRIRRIGRVANGGRWDYSDERRLLVTPVESPGIALFELERQDRGEQ